MKYPVPKEHITLGDVEPQVATARRKVCASTKQKYAWLRYDTCVELPKKKGKEFPAIASSRDIDRLLHEAVPFAGRGREFLMVVCLDSKNIPIGVAVPHVGGRNFANVDASVVLQAAVLSGGVSFILAHNHPTGVAQPSDADIELTKRLVKGASYVGVSMLDHLVVTDTEGKYYSFLDQGVMPRVA